MTSPKPSDTASQTFRFWQHLKPLLTLNENKRSPGFLVVATLATGLPMLAGAWLNLFSSAVLASLGGLVILYMQHTQVSRRMMILVVCSFGFASSFALGTFTSFNLYLSSATLALTVFLVTATCRFYAMPPPGSFFFILVACVARTLPFDLSLAAERTGILLFGCMGACMLALLYSTGQLLFKRQAPVTPPISKDTRIAALLLESAVISLFVGGSYLIALLLQLDNPYWVPVSTAAIMAGRYLPRRLAPQCTSHCWHRDWHGVGLADFFICPQYLGAGRADYVADVYY